MSAAMSKFQTEQTDNSEPGGASQFAALNEAIFRQHAAVAESQAALDALLRLRSSLASGEQLGLDVLSRLRAAATDEERVDLVGEERDWLTTAEAEKFAKVSRSTLRRRLRENPKIGERTPTGGLRFYRPELKKTVFGERQRGAIGANGANDRIRKSSKA
jgi:hypothetical protein